MKLLSHILTFWAGGSFTVAITVVDRTGSLTLLGVAQALGWPFSFLHWLFYA